MVKNDENNMLIDFFESVLKDKTELEILKLILQGKEGDDIIEEMLKIQMTGTHKSTNKKG